MNPYVVAVRAPDSGIKEFEDGSWRIVSEHFASDRLCVDHARQLMPYVITRGGGQVAVYEYDLATQRLKTKPLTLGRSGHKAKDFVLPKDHTEIAPYEPPVAEKLNQNSNQYGAAHGDYAYGRLRADAFGKKAEEKATIAQVISDFAFATTERMLATTAIITVIALSSAIVLHSAVKHGQERLNEAVNPRAGKTLLEMGMDPKQLAAIKNGAIEMTRPAPGRPFYTQVVRVYPTEYGQWNDIIDDVPTAVYNTGRYKSSKDSVPWRTPEQIPTAEHALRP